MNTSVHIRMNIWLNEPSNTFASMEGELMEVNEGL